MSGIETLAKAVRGWRSLGPRKSDGEVMCAGCWDRSEHDTEADHDIPPGAHVFWTNAHPEYGDCDAYCVKCVAEDARDNEIISEAEYDALSAILEKENSRAE